MVTAAEADAARLETYFLRHSYSGVGRQDLVPSNRHPLSCDDCLEDKSEDYQNCSVLYCVPHLYTVISTHVYMNSSYSCTSY